MTISMKANHDGQVNMELDFNIVQAIVVCLALVLLAPKAAAVLAIALLCCAVDRTKPSNNASKPTKTKERIPEAPRIIKQESRIGESSPVRQGVINQQPTSPLFSKLPAEIRNNIYHFLLGSWCDKKIMRADLLLDANELVYKMDGTPNGYAISPQIDATVLRTCHMIYQEALPILYGDNQFHFHTPGQLRHFKGKGIVKISDCNNKGPSVPLVPTFNLQPCPQGRLSLIRRLSLKLGDGFVHSTRDRPYLDDWKDCLYEDFDVEGKDYLCFPSLEQLVLNFRKWALQEDDWVPVKPFIGKFRGKAGLNLLVIFGMKNEGNLERYKRALVQDGGEFFASGPPFRGQIHRA